MSAAYVGYIVSSTKTTQSLFNIQHHEATIRRKKLVNH